jgi:AcrR family transcriptional regulator
MNSAMARSSGRGRRRQAASAEVLESILDAAAEEFAAHGFDGASTRRIAERAGVFQAQLGYHVGAKAELWTATVDRLFGRLRAAIELPDGHDPDSGVVDPAAAFAGVVRAHVRHTADHPQLQRIIALESTAPSERVQYLLDTHVRPVFSLLELVWAEVRAAGRGADVDATWVFLVMIGLGPLPFVQAPVLRPLLGDAAIDADGHADRLLAWLGL